METIVKVWNEKPIRWTEDGRYGCLTDMVNATNTDLVGILSSERFSGLIEAFYEDEKNKKVPLLKDVNGELWGHRCAISEFSFQCKNKNFSVWVDLIIWADILHPEIFPVVMDDVFEKLKQSS